MTVPGTHFMPISPPLWGVVRVQIEDARPTHSTVMIVGWGPAERGEYAPIILHAGMSRAIPLSNAPELRFFVYASKEEADAARL